MPIQDQAGQFLVDAKLTQQYRLANPVGGNMVAPLCDNQGILHVFSRGSDGRLYDIQQDPTSDTGWSAVDMNFNGSGRIDSVAVGIETDGTTIVFVADSDVKYYYARDRRRGGQWRCFFDTGGGPLVDIRLGRDNRGSLLFTAHTVYEGNHFLHTCDYTADNPVQSEIANIYDGEGNFYVNVIHDYQIGPDLSAALYGVSTYLVGQCRKTAQDAFVEAGKKVHWSGGLDDFWAWDEGGGFPRLALAPSPSNPNDSAIFVIRAADGGLSYFDPAAKKLVAISGGVKLSEIKADLDPKGRLSVIALGQDQRLYHVRQDPKSPSGWTDIVALNDQLKFTTVATVKDRDGNIIAFAPDTGFNLYQVWEDPATQDWSFEQVEAGKGPLEQIDAYSSQITVVDALGAPQADAVVELWSTGPMPALVNGESLGLDATTAVSCRTNAAGRVTVVVPTDGLHTPALTIKADFMGPDEGLVIEPNSDIQTKLRGLGAGDLLQPTNADGQPITLLTGKYNSADVAQAVAQAANQAMAMAGVGHKLGPAATARRYVHPRTPTAHVRTVAARDPAAAARIDLANTPDAHWQIDFSSGLPVFKELSRSEAMALMAQRRATLPRAADGFGFDVDWGDVWNSFTSSVAEIVDVVVTAVVDTIKNVVTEIQAQITLLIDQVEHVFDATIDFVEQAFDMVAGVFEKIAVDFKKLFDWLAYVFDWADITRTADVVTYAFNVSLDFLSDAATHAKAAVDGKFDELSTFVRTGMDDFITSFSGSQSIGAFVNPATPPVPVFESRVSHNVLMDALVNNQAQARTLTRANLLGAAAIPQQLLDKLTQLANDFETGDGAHAFQEAVAYFEDIKDNPDQVLVLALQGLLKVVEAIALFAIQGLKALVDLLFDAVKAVIDAFKTVLNEDWSIPLVSEIYQMASGKSLTFKPIDLFSLIVAIPTTSIYKVIKQVAPYPDDDAVADLKANFTAAWLAQRAWGSTAPAAAVGARTEPWLEGLRMTFDISFAVTFVTRAIPETYINQVPPDAPLPQWATLFNLIQRGATSAFSIPWVFKDPSPNPSPADIAEEVIWCLNHVGGPVRGMAHWILQAAGKVDGKVGDATLAIWGGLHVCGVAWLAHAEGQENKYNPMKTAEEVLSCLAPQALKFIRIIPGAGGQVVREVYAVITLLSEPTIAILHVLRTVINPDERARLGMPAPQTPTALAPAAQ